MNNLKQEFLNKSRSYTACISASHRMLFDNIRAIFRHTWLYTLLLAMSIALLSLFYTRALTDGGYTHPSYTLLMVSAVLVACFHVGYVSRIFMLLGHQSMKWNLVRCIRLLGVYLCIMAIVSVVQWGLVYLVIGTGPFVPLYKMPVIACVIIGVSLFFSCVLLPYVYVFVKYLMEPDSKLSKILLKAYKVGWRYWGFIFITLLLAALCAAVCMFFVSIPMLIISMANTLSAIGVGYMGDPSGLPSYFSVLQYVVVALSSFICLYVYVFVIFVCYFMYGSIETREKERKEFLKIK